MPDLSLRSLRRLGAARGCFFTFHRAAPAAQWADLPNRDFYLDLDFLDRLLARLRREGWAVVTVEEALARAARDAPGDRFVNISVDDCYRDTFEAVVPLFRRHGVPVTLYVTTGFPDRTAPFWYTGLEDALVRHDRLQIGGETLDVPDPAGKRAAFLRLSAEWDGPDAEGRYLALCRDNAIDPAAIMERHAISWDMLDALSRDPLVEIGAHTVTHARISAQTPAGALAEMAESGARLRQRLGVPARHFAFPYGRRFDCGPRDFALARDAGFASAATTRKGLMRAGQHAFSLPRNTINGARQSMAMMSAHLSGLTGVAAQVLRRG